MNNVTPRRRTRATGLETATQDLDNPAISLLANYLQSIMKAPTYVSTDRKVTDLLGYHWICEPDVTIPTAKPHDWSVDETKAVIGALECGKLKAAIKTPLHLDEKRTQFAEDLRDKAERYRNCVYLMRYGTKRRTIPSSRWSANPTSPPLRFHTDDRNINVDGNGAHRLFLDASSDSATAIYARLLRKHPRDEDTERGGTYNKRSQTMTQLAENDPSREELPGAYASHDPAPFPRGSSASRPTLSEPWATNVKVVEDKANDPNRKGATVICLTRTGTRLTLKSLKPLLTGDGQLDCEIVDACLSMLVRPMYRLEARPKTVLFESSFWRTYRRHRGHLGCWYDMVAPLKNMEMLLFPVYQDDHWTLFEVSGAEEVIRHYAPVGLDSTDVIDAATACLKTEFEIEGWAVDQRPLPQGDSGVLVLATAIQRVLRKDVEYSQEDIPELRRWITAILLGMNASELGRAFDSF